MSLDAAFRRRVARGAEPDAAIDDMNTAVIRKASLLYLKGREPPISASWFSGNARIKLMDGVITVWPFGGGIGWPPESPEKWSIVDAGAESTGPATKQAPASKKAPKLTMRQKVALAIVRRRYPGDVPADIANLVRLLEVHWELECKRQNAVKVLPLKRDALGRLLRRMALIP
jgi:hypothetical protein